MLEIQCPVGIKCGPAYGLEGDFPITNYSAEAPDSELFVGVNWGWDWNLPRLGTNWTHSSCIGICVSNISQEDADLCAMRANLLCLDDPGGDPTLGDGGGGDPTFAHPQPPPTNTRFYNGPQTCEYKCDDGSINSYTVPFATFVASSQFQADAMAHSYACREVRRRAICLSELFDWACLNELGVEGTITVIRGLHPPMTFAVASGNLPDGMTLSQDNDQSCVISGTPTKAGVFTFGIRATNALGYSHEQQYTVRILGLSNGDQVTDGKCDQSYTFQFDAAGYEGTVTFQEDIVYPPPAGLVLNLNGQLSGSPSGLPETRLMKVLVTDTITLPGGGTDVRSCLCDATITINGPKFTNSPPPGAECSQYNGAPAGFTFTTIPTPCTFTGSVPDGLTMTAGGQVTGYPNVRGTGTFVVTATDAFGNVNSKTFNVTIAATTDTQADPNGFTITIAKSIADIQWSDNNNISTNDIAFDWNPSTGILHFRLNHRDPISPISKGYRVAFLGRCSASSAYNVQYTVYWTFNTELLDNLTFPDNRCITANIAALNLPASFNSNAVPGTYAVAGIAVPVGPPMGNYLRLWCQAALAVGNYVDVYYKIFI